MSKKKQITDKLSYHNTFSRALQHGSGRAAKLGPTKTKDKEYEILKMTPNKLRS